MFNATSYLEQAEASPGPYHMVDAVNIGCLNKKLSQLYKAAASSYGQESSLSMRHGDGTLAAKLSKA